MRKIGKLLILLSLITSSILLASESGKLSGVVLDKETGMPLIGCNIMLVDTYLGAATDQNGRYVILNVQPGIYSLRAQMIGFQVQIVKQVDVSIDMTTTINFDLSTAVIEGEEVTVIARKKIIKKDMTATSSHMKAEELQSLPITEVSEALEMQAGYVNGSLRGGRVGEVAYLIDGIPVTDSYDRSAAIEVNKNMVQELQVISGAFNAEYGKVMSGIVNITTKRGSNNFGGSVETYVGDFFSSHDKIYGNISEINPLNIRNIGLSLHGAIVKDKLFYYLNGRSIYFGGQYQGQKRYEPNAVMYQRVNGSYTLYDSTAMLGNNEWVNMNWNQKNYFQGQLIFRLSKSTNIFYNFFYDNRDYQDYDRNFKYNPDGIVQKNLLGITQLAKIQHQFSSNSFINLGFSSTSRKYESYYSEKESAKDSTTYVHPYYLSTLPYQFIVGGTDNNHEYRDSGTMLAKLDFTSQINFNHKIKTGIEYRYHNIEWNQYNLRPQLGENYVDFSGGPPDEFSPYIHPTILSDSTIYSSSFNHNPWEFAGFIQDKIEYDELIINLGIRFDYFEPDGVILADPSDPEIYNPVKPSNRYHDLNENGMQDEGEVSISVAEREAYWYKDAKSKMKISPRLGISFPISDKGVFHFSYGHFFQIPNFNYLYQNPEFELGSGTGNQGVIGNADLEPEQTIVGEIGVQQQLTDEFSIDVTAYVKDVRDLTGTRAEEIEVFGGATTYSRLVNSDFGVVKGVTLSLNQHSVKGYYVNVDYTFQIAKGTASDPNAYRNAVSGGAEPEVQLNPLSWDQRHTINFVMGYNTASYGMNFLGRFGSGLPYSPRRSEDITSLLTNSAIKPYTISVDLKGFYKTQLFGTNTEFFIRVKNLFDRLNEHDVYDDTGRAGFTTDQEQIEAMNINTPVNSVGEYYRNATYYSEPRRIEIGMRIEL